MSLKKVLYCRRIPLASRLPMSKRICKFIVSPSRNSALESTHTILRKTSHKIELTEISNLASTRIWLESNEVQRVKIGSRHLPRHRWTSEDKLQLESAKRMAGSFALDSKYWTTNHWCVRYHVFVSLTSVSVCEILCQSKQNDCLLARGGSRREESLENHIDFN